MPKARYRIMSAGELRELRSRIDAVRGDLSLTKWVRLHKIHDYRRMTSTTEGRLDAAGVSVEGLSSDFDGEPETTPTRRARNEGLAILGATLRRLRKARGLSQYDLARALGADNSSVSNWEVGWCFLPAERMPELARILGVRLTQLYEGLL